jgi:signal transduction histidine kinase
LEEENYGTLCFAADKAREAPFSDREKTFVELLTQWARYELKQRRDKEQLRRQNERLDRFASVLSHDLRNPLNTAMMNLDLAREADDPVHLTDIGHALDRMRRIIQDVLTLTRSGGIDPGDLSPVRLPPVVEASWSQVDTARATLRNETNAAVRADERRLKRLLENLFRNAVEHGGKEVVVRVGDLSTGFFVEDDGPGIPAEKREEVFDEGYSSNHDGTGLGLSIVETVAEGHDWTLSVTEGPAGGARFEIEGADVVERRLLPE